MSSRIGLFQEKPGIKQSFTRRGRWQKEEIMYLSLDEATSRLFFNSHSIDVCLLISSLKTRHGNHKEQNRVHIR